jgi:tetratricopeptide (TPR) repeat protein
VRRPLLALLVVVYATVFVRLPSFGSAHRLDPLDPRGREVERAIEEDRFADALPIARTLDAADSSDPTVAVWLAEIHHGLRQPVEEAAFWERVLRAKQADTACPPLADAYAAAGDDRRALDAYERCAAVARDDPERWFDLAAAYLSRGRAGDAEQAFARSRALDPSNPRLPPPVTATADGEGVRR